MTPGARIQAAIEQIDQILMAWQSERRIPADKMLEHYFKSHRYIGSKDRGAVSELVYWVLRHKAALEWWINKSFLPLEGGGSRWGSESAPAFPNDPYPTLPLLGGGRLFVFAAIILRKDYNPESIKSVPKDSQYSPPPFDEHELKMFDELVRYNIEHPEMPDHVRLNYPEWLDERLRESFGDAFDEELHALNEQAPTDLRVNTLKTTREQLMQDLHKEGFECAPTTLSPTCLRLAKRGPVFTSAPFKLGHFEVQDEGSQCVAQLVDAQPGQRVIDFCAGAGGKTLALAAMMKNKGRILAWDTSEKRLAQIVPRLRRAGVDTIQTHIITSENDAFIKRHKGTADRVLVDAPCSGSGTWRRNPDLKWRFNEKDLQEVTALQASILLSASRLVKKGGRLIYATCSVLKDENERQIEQLLKTSNNFKVVCVKKMCDKGDIENINTSDGVSYFRVTPHQDGVDGFFSAVLERVQD